MGRIDRKEGLVGGQGRTLTVGVEEEEEEEVDG